MVNLYGKPDALDRNANFLNHVISGLFDIFASYRTPYIIKE